jgi:hypothetical protein
MASTTSSTSSSGSGGGALTSDQIAAVLAPWLVGCDHLTRSYVVICHIYMYICHTYVMLSWTTEIRTDVIREIDMI